MGLFKRKGRTTNLADELRKQARMQEELKLARQGKFPKDKGPTRGVAFQASSAFSSFRDFATDFANSQKPTKEVKKQMPKKRRGRKKSRR